MSFASLSLKRARLSPVVIVFLVALVARLWVLCQAADTVEFLPEQGDMKFYSDWARRIASGIWTDHRAFYGLPGYAYWLAGIYSLFGFQPYIAAFLQIVAEAFTATIIFRLAPRAFARDTEKGADPAQAQQGMEIGLVAALGWIFFVPAQAYSTVLMPTAYLVAAFWYVVWWVLRRRSAPPAPRDFLLLGLLMGVVAMMVANILFLLPLVLAAIWLRRDWQQHATRLRVLAAALLFTGVGIGVLPCALHNYLIAGEPVLLSAHGGINFYIGNNAQANGYPEVPAPLHTDQQGMLKDSILWAERAAGHPLKRAEVSAFWSSLATQYIREHPLAWLRLLAVKLGNFWNGFQYDDIGVLSPLREDGVLLPGPGFGLVAALALAGLALAVWQRRPRAGWIAAAVGLHIASLLTVFVTERYRLAAVPGLLLFGAFGVVEGCRELTARHARALAIYGTALAAAILLVNLPVDPGVIYVDDYNSALADMEQGRLVRAEAKLERVYAGNPLNAETNFALGNLWLAKGSRDKAKYFYRRTLDLDPTHGRVMNNLGVLALEEKRWALAEAFLLGALRIDPEDAKTNYLLAQVRLEEHDLNGAHAAMAEALRLRPGDPQFLKLNDRLAAAAQ